jgi:hypothetical protein
MATGEHFDHQVVARMGRPARLYHRLSGKRAKERGREGGQEDVAHINPGM